MRKIPGQIRAQTLRTDNRSHPGVRGGIHFGELHYYRSSRRIHIDGVVVAGELAVKIKRSAGKRDVATIVIAGPCCSLTEERPGKVGLLPPSAPKLGKLTTVVVLPPQRPRQALRASR